VKKILIKSTVKKEKKSSSLTGLSILASTIFLALYLKAEKKSEDKKIDKTDKKSSNFLEQFKKINQNSSLPFYYSIVEKEIKRITSSIVDSGKSRIETLLKGYLPTGIKQLTLQDPVVTSLIEPTGLAYSFKIPSILSTVVVLALANKYLYRFTPLLSRTKRQKKAGKTGNGFGPKLSVSSLPSPLGAKNYPRSTSIKKSHIEEIKSVVANPKVPRNKIEDGSIANLDRGILLTDKIGPVGTRLEQTEVFFLPYRSFEKIKEGETYYLSAKVIKLTDSTVITPEKNDKFLLRKKSETYPQSNLEEDRRRIPIGSTGDFSIRILATQSLYNVVNVSWRKGETRPILEIKKPFVLDINQYLKEFSLVPSKQIKNLMEQTAVLSRKIEVVFQLAKDFKIANDLLDRSLENLFEPSLLQDIVGYLESRTDIFFSKEQKDQISLFRNNEIESLKKLNGTVRNLKLRTDFESINCFIKEEKEKLLKLKELLRTLSENDVNQEELILQVKESILELEKKILDYEKEKYTLPVLISYEIEIDGVEEPIKKMVTMDRFLNLLLSLLGKEQKDLQLRINSRKNNMDIDIVITLDNRLVGVKDLLSSIEKVIKEGKIFSFKQQIKKGIEAAKQIIENEYNLSILLSNNNILEILDYSKSRLDDYVLTTNFYHTMVDRSTKWGFKKNSQFNKTLMVREGDFSKSWWSWRWNIFSRLNPLYKSDKARRGELNEVEKFSKELERSSKKVLEDLSLVSELNQNLEKLLLFSIKESNTFSFKELDKLILFLENWNLSNNQEDQSNLLGCDREIIDNSLVRKENKALEQYFIGNKYLRKEDRKNNSPSISLEDFLKIKEIPNLLEEVKESYYDLYRKESIFLKIQGKKGKVNPRTDIFYRLANLFYFDLNVLQSIKGSQKEEIREKTGEFRKKLLGEFQLLKSRLDKKYSFDRKDIAFRTNIEEAKQTGWYFISIEEMERQFQLEEERDALIKKDSLENQEKEVEKIGI